MIMFRETHPILGTRDIRRAIAFYTRQLGFELAFGGKAVFSEYRLRGVECNPEGVHDTPWGTREFALYDVDRNALTFYRDLTSAERERLYQGAAGR